jgi:type I restriction enzyme S subunit
MNSNWPSITIEEVCDRLIDYRGKTPKKTDAGIRLITAKVVKSGRILDDRAEFISEAEYERWMTRGIPERGDVLLTTEAPLGEVAILRTDGKIALAQRIILLRAKSGILDGRYLLYAIQTPLMQGRLSARASGTTVIGIKNSELRKVELPVPPLHIQQRIAFILSAYDDLIENNRRRIQLLEQAARLLYNEWFVHLRFPGHEHVAISDGVPEEWEKKKIAEVCETVGGGTPSTKVSEYWEGDITWVVPSDITKNDCLALLDSERKITEKGLRESSAKIVPAETILMTSRASVGFFALMDFEVCTNQGFINIIPHEDELRMYLLFNLMSRVTEIRSNAKGTTYPEISKGRFRGMDIVVPSKSLVSEFAQVSTDIIQQVRYLKRTTFQLTKARDLLLPRLMNGEVAV